MTPPNRSAASASAKPYRDPTEVEEWKKRDPVLLFELHLINQGVATVEMLRHIRESVKAEVDEAVVFARESAFPSVDELFDDLYATPVLPRRNEARR